MEQRKPTCDERIALTILSYLIKHPAAKDTLEGIASWWLLSERVDESLQKVGEALDYLESRALVIGRRKPDREMLFGLNHDKEDEIRQILEMKTLQDGPGQAGSKK